mmetsp:Transcript_28635/g.93545  ORF Transcript_28635/g.93545 Transcript_28635/m.93545 type:complete len:223 (+) Transcript_28635:135-803(+)
MVYAEVDLMIAHPPIRLAGTEFPPLGAADRALPMALKGTVEPVDWENKLNAIGAELESLASAAAMAYCCMSIFSDENRHDMAMQDTKLMERRAGKLDSFVQKQGWSTANLEFSVVFAPMKMGLAVVRSQGRVFLRVRTPGEEAPAAPEGGPMANVGMLHGINMDAAQRQAQQMQMQMQMQPPHPQHPQPTPAPAGAVNFCAGCGTKRPSGAKFCAQCGNSFA